MKTSIATVCLSGGLSEKLYAIAAAGFCGVEIFEDDLLAYHGTAFWFPGRDSGTKSVSLTAALT